MLKKLSVIVSVLISAGSLFAVQIDTALLDTATRPDYIEDTSPVPKNEFNSAKQIRDMGRRLGGSIKRQDAQHKSGEHYASGAPSKKYSARRVPSSDSLPGADIIYIAPNAKVGTIKALTFIVSGYIEDTSPVPKNEFNTAKQIRDMGRRLGGSIKRQDAQHKNDKLYASGAPSKKYRAHRVPSSDSLPGADIIYIAPNAKVGTIKALAFIVSGYIEAAYGLPLNEADTVAQKVCWWNTNHYDDRNYFTKHFNARILESFSDETAVIGLADSYKNWAGHARIVIPFEKIKDTQTAAKDGTKQSAKIDSKNKEAQKNSDVEKNTAQNKKEGIGKDAAQNDADKNAAGTMRNTLRKEALQFKTVPANYKILFGALCLAALLIIVLLVRVIIDMARN